MVTVREHSSWVTESEDEATAKALVIARAGLMRVRNQSALIPSKFSVNPNTLILGGGIAGMQAALDIASSGNKAYLVERQPTVGGPMLQYDKTFPTLDCAACIGTPKMVAVGQDKNINLMTNTEVESVSGFVGNFKVNVNQRSRYVQTNCTGCGDCAKVCPVEAPNEWDAGTKMRKAIYISFPQAVPVGQEAARSGITRLTSISAPASMGSGRPGRSAAGRADASDAGGAGGAEREPTP